MIVDSAVVVLSVVSVVVVASDISLVVSVKTGFITDPSKAVLLPPRELLVAGKELAQNSYSRANDGLRRAVAGKSIGERTELFLCELDGIDFGAEPTYDQRGRMDLAAATTIRAAVLTLIADGVDKSAVLPATDSRSLRMVVSALLSFHVLQLYGESAVLPCTV